MDSNKEVLTFLDLHIPQFDSILLGCRADEDVDKHECCEYNIISLNDSQSSSQRLRYYSYPSGNNESNKKIFLVRVLPIDELNKNSLIKYSDFVYFPSQFFKSNESNIFIEKNQQYRRSFRFNLKTEILNNLYDLTCLSNTLSKSQVNEKTLSFDLKMMSLRTLRIYIHNYLNKEHRPTHLKYQTNSVIQNESMAIRERIDLILETIGTHRFNISALNRSEISLKFLLGNVHSPTKKLIMDKVHFLREKSMYVDAMLVIYNYILDNFQSHQQKRSYQQLLMRTTNIDNKEKITLIKEINLLKNFNKILI